MVASFLAAILEREDVRALFSRDLNLNGRRSGLLPFFSFFLEYVNRYALSVAHTVIYITEIPYLFLQPNKPFLDQPVMIRSFNRESTRGK